MDYSKKRNSIRNEAWQDTVATIKVINSSSFGSRKTISIKGIVDNISSTGLFLKTNNFIPIHTLAGIIIDFDPNSKKNSVIALGETIRVTKNGVGIKFTSIDISALQRCIINKINNYVND